MDWTRFSNPLQHNCCARPIPADEGTIFQPNQRGGEVDEQAATELELYLDNDRRFAPNSPEGQGHAVAVNLIKKIGRGRYNHSQAPQAWSYVVESAAKAYAKEFAEPRDWSTIFSPATRRKVSQDLADQFLHDVKQGEYEHLLGHV